MVPIHTFVKPLSLIIAALCLCVTPAWAEDEINPTDELIYNTTFGSDDMVLMMIEEGASPTAVNDDGVPVINLAAARKGEKGLAVLKALLASNADVNQTDKNGQSALFYAARVGNLEAVKLLLESGADYYLVDKTGTIARNVAYSRGYMEIFNYMDDFINKKREGVLKAYEDRDKELLKEKEAASKAKAEAEAKAKELDEKLNAPEPKEEPKKPAYPPIDEQVFNDAVHNLSYHTCVMQYWYYVKGARMKTSLSPDELNHTITEHNRKSKTHTKTLQSFGANEGYIRRIVKPSKDLIYKELESFGSNITRNSHGIGEAEDADKRCHAIADNWLLGL